MNRKINIKKTLALKQEPDVEESIKVIRLVIELLELSNESDRQRLIGFLEGSIYALKKE